MIEGWHNDLYVVIFEGAEITAASLRYDVEKYLPSYDVVGIIGWDDLVVRDKAGVDFTVPAVPISLEETKILGLSVEEVNLSPDSRAKGKIKWYIKPIVFGGDPNVGENMMWVTHDQHGQLVRWWNHMYRSV